MNETTATTTGVTQKILLAIRLFALQRSLDRDVKLLLDVHGHQVFFDGCFNGDPHPGNILKMPDGRLGLIDYGQCKVLRRSERLGLARIVAAIKCKGDRTMVRENGRKNSGSDYADDNSDDVGDDEELLTAMHDLGFRTGVGRGGLLSDYAELMFDSDARGGEIGMATPQLYFEHLSSIDKLVNVPDPAGKS